MEEQSAREFITIEKTTFDLEHWSAIETLSTPLRASIRGAELVIVPFEGFREYSGPVFPVGTEDLFRFLRDKSHKVEIAVEDADYREIALHFDVMRIATIIVKESALAIGAAWLIEYVKNSLNRSSGKTEVRANIIVDQTNVKGRKAVQISYQGPADTFERSMKEAISNLTNSEPASGKATANDGRKFD